jgi:hypothetical protein
MTENVGEVPEEPCWELPFNIYDTGLLGAQGQKLAHLAYIYGKSWLPLVKRKKYEGSVHKKGENVFKNSVKKS